MRRAAASILALGVAAGCAVGPDYKRPVVAAPDAFYEEAAAAQAASLADMPWWQVFDDPTIQALIAEALAKGYDPQIAAWRVDEARAQAGIARSEFFPQVGYQAQFQREFPSSIAVVGEEVPGLRAISFHAVNVNATWEVDLWGRIRRLNEAARAQFLAAEDNRRGVLLTLVSSVAQAYCELRELDAELEIARRNMKAFGDTLDLFQRRLDAGVASGLETARAEAALAQVAAQVPLLEAQVVAKENQLSFLLGRNPGPIERGASLGDLPLPPDVPPGLPSALLERRPDLRETEQALIAANASVGVATANFFPAISLTGMFGGVSPDVSDLFGPGKVWSIAAGLLGPLFQGGRLRSQYDVSMARWNQARLAYEQAVIGAFGDVSTALVAKLRFAESEVQTRRQVTALLESVRLSNLRYISGLADYFEVLEAQQQLFPAEIALAQARLNQLVAVIRLYRVLGGGWNIEDPTWTAPGSSAAPAPATPGA